MKQIITSIFLCLISFSVSAQYATLRGTATLKFKGQVVTLDEKEKAIFEASMDAIERYFSEKGESQNQIFETNKEKIISNLDSLIKNQIILAEQTQQDLKRYQLSLKVELNEGKLKNIIKSTSSVSSASNIEKSNIVYFFAARKASSVKSYDARIVKVNQSTIQQDASVSSKTAGKEGEKISNNQISTNSSKSVANKLDVFNASKIESGGSITNKKDEIGYQEFPMGAYKPAMTQIFTVSGFSVYDSDYIISDVEKKNIYQNFSNGEEISGKNLSNIIKAIKSSKEKKYKYFVLATINVGLGTNDPSSNMKRVSVEISARLFNIESGVEDIASVGPVQYASLGRDEEEASTSALKKGAEMASREIVSQLNNLGIK